MSINAFDMATSVRRVGSQRAGPDARNRGELRQDLMESAVRALG